jgi:hypothetical protein
VALASESLHIVQRSHDSRTVRCNIAQLTIACLITPSPSPPHNERGCRSQANRDEGRGDLWTLCSFRESSRLLIPGTSRHTNKKSVAANLARTACSRPSAGLLELLAGLRWVMLAIAICAFRSGRARSSDVLAQTVKRGVHCHVFEYPKKRLSGGLWRAAYRCVGRTTLNHHQQE